MAKGDKPLDTLRDGAIKVTFWKNSKKDENGSFISTKLTRTFTDNEGDFHDSDSLTGKYEVLRAARLLNKAVDRIEELEATINS